MSVQVAELNKQEDVKAFQYILCVGSRLKLLKQLPQLQSFNTSYVSVQVLSFFGISFHFPVSIHPMCRFKKYDKELGKFFFVSIHPMCRFKLNQANFFLIEFSFNTSYVSVQDYHQLLLEMLHKGFNTSYVSVQVIMG